MPRFPYIIFAVQMIVVPFYILFGILALWVGKHWKKIPIEQFKYHRRYFLVRLTQSLAVLSAYLLAIFVTPFLLIGSIIVAYGYNFWGWYA
jgi:hypothetical protein